MVDLLAIAKEVESGIQATEKVLAVVTPIAGFIPGAAVPLAAIGTILPIVDKALATLISTNNGDVFAAVQELISHLSPAQPNSAVLSPPAISTAG